MTELSKDFKSGVRGSASTSRDRTEQAENQHLWVIKIMNLLRQDQTTDASSLNVSKLLYLNSVNFS